jgi:hypothetical protein
MPEKQLESSSIDKKEVDLKSSASIGGHSSFIFIYMSSCLISRI